MQLVGLTGSWFESNVKRCLGSHWGLGMWRKELSDTTNVGFLSLAVGGTSKPRKEVSPMSKDTH